VLGSSSLRLDFDTRRRVLTVGGDIDMEATGRFEAELLEHARGGDVLVDLSAVTFFPSRAAGAAAQAARQADRQHGTLVTFTAEQGSIAAGVLFFLDMLGPADPPDRTDEPPS
jgi:anti-anti-sigma regulatory factor